MDSKFQFFYLNSLLKTVFLESGLHQRANVTVIAATNRPDKIDRALLRQGAVPLY